MRKIIALPCSVPAGGHGPGPQLDGDAVRPGLLPRLPLPVRRHVRHLLLHRPQEVQERQRLAGEAHSHCHFWPPTDSRNLWPTL